MSKLELRPATVGDALLLWEWRNDPEVRAWSFHSEPVAWESHCAWLEGKLASDDCRLWILLEDGVPTAQVRYDRRGAEAEVSFAVAAPFRARGLGTTLLRLSAPLACRELLVKRLTALVKRENVASIRAFERANFRRVAEVSDPEPCLKFERACTSTAADAGRAREHRAADSGNA